MFPSFSCIFRFPNSVTRRNISANGFFSHSGIYYIVVTFRNCDSTYRSSKESVRNICPSVPCIGCFPNASTCASHIKKIGFASNTSYSGTSPSSMRSYISPFCCTKIFRRNFVSFFLCSNFDIYEK